MNDMQTQAGRASEGRRGRSACPGHRQGRAAPKGQAASVRRHRGCGHSSRWSRRSVSACLAGSDQPSRSARPCRAAPALSRGMPRQARCLRVTGVTGSSRIAGSAFGDIWAVGDRLPNSEAGDPAPWSTGTAAGGAYFAGASLGGRQASLTSVAVLAPDDAWAVGSFASVGSTPPAPLIEHWNGRSWSLRPTLALARLTTTLPQTLTSVAALGSARYLGAGHPRLELQRCLPALERHLLEAAARTEVRPALRVGGDAGHQHRSQRTRLGSRGMDARLRRGQAFPAEGLSSDGTAGGGRSSARPRGLSRSPWWPLSTGGDAWAVTGGSFTTSGTYGISPVQVLHWDGRRWQVTLHLGGAGSVAPAGLVATIGRRCLCDRAKREDRASLHQALGRHPLADRTARASRAHARTGFCSVRKPGPDGHQRWNGRRAGCEGPCGPTQLPVGTLPVHLSPRPGARLAGLALTAVWSCGRQRPPQDHTVAGDHGCRRRGRADISRTAAALSDKLCVIKFFG